jgi:ADP-ribosylglycohydrolase
MRVLPLALWHRGGIAALIEDAHRQCLPTHGHPRSQVCCALYCLWVRALLDGGDDGFDDAVAALQAHYTGDRVRAGELAQVLAAAEREHPRGSGYVVDTLWSARHAFAGSVGFAGAVRAAIALGHDTDTTGCVAGGLAGLRSGLSGIPPAWRDGLRGADLYEPLLDALLAHAAESVPR